MSPSGSRNRALRCPQRPAITARGINTPDDPSLYGPSPTPHPNRPGNRGKVNHDDLTAAITVIYDVAFDRRHHDPHRVATAHNTLARQRHQLAGPLRGAVDHYLADDTWHHGPRYLRWAIHHIATHAGIDNPDNIGPIAEQATLF